MGKDDPSLWLPIHHLIHLYWASGFYSKEVIQAISKILKFNSFNFSSTFLVRIKSSHMSFCIYQCFHLNKYLCYPKCFKTHLKKKNYRINYLFIFPWQLQRKSCPAAPQPFECLAKLDPFLTPSKHTFPLVKSFSWSCCYLLNGTMFYFAQLWPFPPYPMVPQLPRSMEFKSECNHFETTLLKFTYKDSYLTKHKSSPLPSFYLTFDNVLPLLLNFFLPLLPRDCLHFLLFPF